MKKFITAIDGLKYSDSAAAYAVHLGKQASAHVVGIFLDDFTYHSYQVYDVVGERVLAEGEMEKMESKDLAARDEAVERFEHACREAGLNYSIHHDKSIAILELLHESIYADLLVIDGKETLTHYKEKIPTRFIRNLLAEAQCPVLVTPQVYRPIDKVVLLYDGEPGSVFAIRAFSYVLPSLKNLEIEVISVKNNRQSMHVPDNRLMKEFMKRHFPHASFTVLQGIPEMEIVSHLKSQDRNMLIVLGAYRRGMVSRWLRPSMADVLMEQVGAPLFITHNK